MLHPWGTSTNYPGRHRTEKCRLSTDSRRMRRTEMRSLGRERWWERWRTVDLLLRPSVTVWHRGPTNQTVITVGDDLVLSYRHEKEVFASSLSFLFRRDWRPGTRGPRLTKTTDKRIQIVHLRLTFASPSNHLKKTGQVAWERKSFIATVWPLPFLFPFFSKQTNDVLMYYTYGRLEEYFVFVSFFLFLTILMGRCNSERSKVETNW